MRERDGMRRESREPGPVRVAHAPDYLLLTSVLMLCVFGLIAVYSSSYALGSAEFDDTNYFVKRQAFALALGLAAMVLAMRVNYHFLLRLSPLIMLIALIGLGAVLVPGLGHESNGAQSWVQLGPLPPVQPSEFAKFAVVVYLAAWLAAKRDVLHDISLGVVPFVGMVGLVGALIMLQPDLGTAFVVAAITGTLFFIAGARLFHVLVLAASALLMMALLIASGGYRMDRITSFTSAESDPTGVGFHTLQLLVAFGSGGLTGLGLGVSRQKFFYIPGSHTDGVLAIVGEELGFIGVGVVIALVLLLLYRGWRIVRDADTHFGSLVAVGMVSWFAFQTLINVGGVTRLIPLTGIPLPLISYGGSSLVITLASLGVLLSVSRYTREAEAVEEPAPRRESTVRPRRTPVTTGGAR
ncbi:MAG: putative lipid II flippase FtsW [Dehalococcoidia bacterium]